MEKVRVQGETLVQAQSEMAEHMRKMSEDAAAPMMGHRGPDGRIAMVQRGSKRARIERTPEGISIVPEAMQ